MGKKRKQVPLEVIERWLKDSDWRVRAAAMNACQAICTREEAENYGG